MVHLGTLNGHLRPWIKIKFIYQKEMGDAMSKGKGCMAPKHGGIVALGQ